MYSYRRPGPSTPKVFRESTSRLTRDKTAKNKIQNSNDHMFTTEKPSL